MHIHIRYKLSGKDKVSPSTPILPSPSVSPAARKALVSLSVSALAEAEKFCRNSLEGGQSSHKSVCGPCINTRPGGDVKVPYFSSSSSMKPLLSWSMMAKAFLTSSALLLARPHVLKKDLWLKESAAVTHMIMLLFPNST